MKLPLVSRTVFDMVLDQYQRLVEERRIDKEDQRIFRAAERERFETAMAAAKVARDEELARMQAMYERMIDQQASTQRTAIEQLTNLINFGKPTRDEAVIAEREPDAETRLARRVTQETLVAASAALRAEYAARGIPVTDKELEDEAQTLMLGLTWTPPASLAGLVKD